MFHMIRYTHYCVRRIYSRLPPPMLPHYIIGSKRYYLKDAHDDDDDAN